MSGEAIRVNNPRDAIPKVFYVEQKDVFASVFSTVDGSRVWTVFSSWDCAECRYMGAFARCVRATIERCGGGTYRWEWTI